jgi:hypothetical protein
MSLVHHPPPRGQDVGAPARGLAVNFRPLPEDCCRPSENIYTINIPACRHHYNFPAFVLVDAGTRDPGCQGVSTR